MLNGVKETGALLEAMEQTVKPTTKADRIRAMSDKELAEAAAHMKGSCPPDALRCGGKSCVECWLRYLRTPA